jgi:DNA polymerase-3 subunit delta
LKSVFLLVGDEQFLKEEWLRDARARIFKENASGALVDYNLFFADDMDPAEAIGIANTKPFLNPKRFIVIKNIESLKSAVCREQILNYLGSPSPDTILALEADVKEKDYPQDRFLSEAAKFSQVVPFKRLYDANLSAWIAKRAFLRKKKIEPAASELLKQLKGNNLRAIDEEMEKLSLYADQRALITRSDVELLTGKDTQGTVYEILEAMNRGDKERVLSLSADFDADELGGAIGLFCWNLRLLLRIKELLRVGLSPQETGNRLNLKKFQLERTLPQTRRFKTSWLKNAISEFTEFDLQIKTGALADSIASWQMLLVRLLGLL